MQPQTPSPLQVSPLQDQVTSKEQIAQPSAGSKRKLIWGLIGLLGPTALILLGLLLYAVFNLLFATPETLTDGNLLTEEPAVQKAVNILLFSVGGFATLAWLPGIIFGIVLLAQYAAGRR